MKVRIDSRDRKGDPEELGAIVRNDDQLIPESKIPA
jgi:hypothetical protein